MADRPWSEADRELVRDEIVAALDLDDHPHDPDGTPAWQAAGAVLDALTARRWRREADVRAEVSTEIAGAVRQQLTEGDDHA